MFNRKTRPRNAFVLMPFCKPFNAYYPGIFKPALAEAGYEVTRADDLFSPQPIMLDIQRYIQDSDLILCEMSGRNPNVFYELGLAHAIGKPAILLSNNSEDIPFDLAHVRVVLYSSIDVGWERKLYERIKAAAEAVKTSNEIWPPPLKTSHDPVSALGVLKIESPRYGDIKVGRFAVTGTFEAVPSDLSVQLFIASPDGTECWPQGPVQFDIASKTWCGYVALYDRPVREADIVLAHVGKAGRILCDYYTRVGDESRLWFPLRKLPLDIVEYDRVRIGKFLDK